jgi:glutaredoxin 3
MKIKLYTTTTCPFCKQEKAFLDSKNIKYENHFVDEDEKAAEEMVKISGQMGVPFAVITQDDGSVVTILGFDKSKLESALNVK